jgi:hypothetical protein
MASYTGNKIKDTYQSIVKAIDNSEIGATDKQLTDGVGNELGLHVNTSGDFRIEGDLRVDGAIKDSLNSPGTSGQILISTLTGTDWQNVSDNAVSSVTGGTGIDVDAAQGDVTISVNTEDLQDLIGAMVSGNTETNIQVTYDDVNGKLNFVSTDFDTTYTAGTGLDLTGTVFSHDNTSDQASSTNTGRTYIQSIQLDEFGHVTGLSTATETTDSVTLVAGDGIDVSGYTITHEDTSTQSSVSNTGSNFIQSITLDTFGHITAITTATTADTTYSADEVTLTETSEVFSIKNGGVDTLQLASNSVTDDKIAADSVGASELKITGNGIAGQVIISDGDGTFSYDDVVTSVTAGNALAVDQSTGDLTISVNNNSIGADELNVSGDGTAGQYLTSDGDGSFSWTTGSGGGGSSTVNLEATKDGFTGDGSTTSFTISDTVTTVDQISVYFDGVYQNNEDGAEFSISGTTLSFTTAPESGVDIEVVTLAPGSDTLISGSGTTNYLPKFTGTYEIGNSSISESSEIIDIDVTGALVLPVSTTANRPAAPEIGMIRYNTTTSKYETYSGSAWENMRPTAGGGIGFSSNTYSVTAGSGLSQDTNGLSHDDTSSQASSTNTGSTVIQSISLDGFGHVTNIGTATVSLTDTTYTAGSGLSLTSTTFAHEDTSTQASSSNTGRTYIQSVGLDTYGHVTSLSTATETVTDTTYTAGNGLDLTGTTFSHEDTSTQASSTNTGRTYIQSIGVDTYGHITSLSTGTETVTDTTYSASGNGLDLTGTAFSHADTSSLASTSNTGRTYIQNVTVDEFGHLTGVTTATETAGEGTTYTAGSGLDLSGSNVFSVESDLRDGITYIGLDASDYIYFNNNTAIDFYTNGNNRMRLEQDGDLHVDADIIAYSTTTSSDERLKDNIKVIESATDKLKQLKGVEFTWKKNGKNGGGVIAQDVEKVLPGAVKDIESLEGDKSYKAVDYNAIIGLLIQTNKELLERIETLENKQ